MSKPVSPLLFTGFAIASIGGPLALPSFFPGTAGDAADSAALVVLLALAVFAVPLGIWLAYSGRVVSPGGLPRSGCRTHRENTRVVPMKPVTAGQKRPESTSRRAPATAPRGKIGVG